MLTSYNQALTESLFAILSKEANNPYNDEPNLRTWLEQNGTSLSEVDPLYAGVFFERKTPLIIHALNVNQPAIAKQLINNLKTQDLENFEQNLGGLCLDSDGLKHNVLHALCMTRTDNVVEQEAALQLLETLLGLRNKHGKLVFDCLEPAGDGRTPVELALTYPSHDLTKKMLCRLISFRCTGNAQELLKVLADPEVFSEMASNFIKQVFSASEEPYWAIALRVGLQETRKMLYQLNTDAFNSESLKKKSNYFNNNGYVTAAIESFAVSTDYQAFLKEIVESQWKYLSDRERIDTIISVISNGTYDSSRFVGCIDWITSLEPLCAWGDEIRASKKCTYKVYVEEWRTKLSEREASLGSPRFQ